MKEFEIFKTLEVGAMGYNHSHGKDYVHSRPNGIGCYLMLLVKTPALFELNHNKIEVKGNSLVLISPTTPCSYKPLGDSYIDDWLYFSFDESEKPILEQLHIPVDTPVQLGHIEDISQIIHFMAFEHYSSDLYHNEVKKSYTSILFYKISRIIQSHIVQSDSLFATKNDKLTYLRTHFYNDPTYFKDIDSMADFVNLSRSGFQHLYKKIFGINVKTDLILARIAYCKKLLDTTPFTVAEIASKAGYKSEYSFMRQFKEKTGLTPTEYRKLNAK